MRTTRFETIGAVQEPPTSWSDLVQSRFGRLTAIGYTGIKTKHRQKQITCHCDCGFYVHVSPAGLRSGATTSCGCAHSEAVVDRNKKCAKHGAAVGRATTPEYRAWRSMLDRCFNANNSNYVLYGGRGITVCGEWLTDFSRFFADVGKRPSRQHSLDRIDNDLGYTPENVRWALPAEQTRNQRNTKRYMFEGRWLTLGEIAEQVSVSRELLYARVEIQGWNLADATSTPVAREVSDDNLYGRWHQMIQRCTDPGNSAYCNYGGRGIRVCERWQQSFAVFAEDVGSPPTAEAYTLDRIDNNGDYEPGNVRWATPTTQSRNRRNTKFYVLAGIKRSLSEWADLVGLDPPTVRRRLKYGWPLEEVLGTPKSFGRCAAGERRRWVPEDVFATAHLQWASLTPQDREQQLADLLHQHRLLGFPWGDVEIGQEGALARVGAGTVSVKDDVVVSVSGAGQKACLSAHPHRFEAKHRGQPSVVEAFNDDKMLTQALRYQLKRGDPVTPKRVLNALQALVRAPRNFPPALARWLVDEYAPRHGVVLDPCAGYGGRLLGALASRQEVSYIGFDVEPDTVRGNLDLARRVGCQSRVAIGLQSVEDPEPWPEADLVVTSPPYYDREWYGVEAESKLASYSSYEAWCEGFL